MGESFIKQLELNIMVSLWKIPNNGKAIWTNFCQSFQLV